MYREIWTIGKGTISPEAFFTYANESLYLFNCLRLKGPFEIPPLTHGPEATPVINKHASKFAELMHAVHADWKKNLKQIVEIKTLVTKMGIPDTLDVLNTLEKFIRAQGQNEPLSYLGRNIGDIYKHMWALIQILQLSYDEYNVFNKAGNVTHPESSLRANLDLTKIRGSTELMAANAHA